MSIECGVEYVLTDEGNLISVVGLETTISAPAGVLDWMQVVIPETGAVYRMSVTYPDADTTVFGRWVKQ